ncbi:MAG: ECF transporter S component [Clostridia bacterium]|nr:ECF transporter S component [Clostridia bacterium]
MNRKKTNYYTKIGVLSAIAFILQVIGSIMQLKVAGFLEIEFSDLPAIIGALALGPLAGVLIEFIKNFLHLTISSTGFVGELANFVINGIFVFTVGLVYAKNKTKKGAILALISGCIIMPVAAAFANFFIMLPLYMPSAEFSAKLSLVLTTITPFNFVRGACLAIITILCYKSLSPILHK